MKSGNSIFAVLAEALEKNKKLRTILYAALIILALAIFLTSVKKISNGCLTDF